VTFRPFWRTNQGWFNAPSDPRYFFYPGETVEMVFQVVAESEVRLMYERFFLSNRSKYIEISNFLLYVNISGPYLLTYLQPLKYGIMFRVVPRRCYHNQTIFQTTFNATGFGPKSNLLFKRVNSIDQKGNEGKPVIPTDSRVTDSFWLNCDLIGVNSKLVPLMPTNSNFNALVCPNATYVHVTSYNSISGGEAITLGRI
jgi:hypothetical protein